MKNRSRDSDSEVERLLRGTREVKEAVAVETDWESPQSKYGDKCRSVIYTVQNILIKLCLTD